MSDTLDDLTQRLADERHAQVVTLLTEVRDRVQVQNGRIGTLERQVAVLEDRSPGRIGMISGGVAAGAIAVIYQLVQMAIRK